MNLSPHDQIDNHSRAGEALTMGRRAGDCDYRPVRVGQGGHHAVSVGGHALHSRSAGCFDVTSLNSRGRIAICAPRLSNSRIARLGPPRRLSDRQRAGANPLGYRLSATFKTWPRFLIGGGNQLNRISDKPASDLANLFHLERLSSVRGFNTHTHSERTLTVAQKPGPSGAKSV